MLLIFLSLWVIAIAFASEKKSGEIDSVHSETGLNCADCHDTDKPERRAAAAKCVECHSSKDDDAPISFKDEMDTIYKVNPHSSHAGNMRCTLCHKIHAESTLYCNESCHKFLLTVP